MKTYRSRPAQIQAQEFTPYTEVELSVLADGYLRKISEFGDDYRALRIAADGAVWAVCTLEGWVVMPFGHYLIHGLNGEWYPCDPDVFAKRWELVTQEDDE